MSSAWVQISVPLQSEALDDVIVSLHNLVGSSYAVESRPCASAGGWSLTAHAYVMPGEAQCVTRWKVLRTLELLRLAGAGAVGVASEACVQPDEYLTRWREFYVPVAVGERLLIVPAWEEPPVEWSGRIPIFLDSAQAFGTGHHPTTKLALEALEGSVVPDSVVIDVGTGSGVLAIAAAKLGAGRVYAYDRDSRVLQPAQANIARNQVRDRIVLSVPSRTIDPPERAQVLVANIVAAVHLELMSIYARVVMQSGTVLLGGLLVERVDEVMSSAQACGFRLESSAALGDWRALTLRRNPGCTG